MRHLPQAAIAALVAAMGTAATPPRAQAQGFATKDLTAAMPAMKGALGPEFIARGEPQQLTFACLACAGEPMVGVILGRQTDGTEQRVRSGATTVADLEKLCRDRSAGCRVSALDVRPAVGWVSSYAIGANAGATAVLIRDGDMLTVRSVAKDAGAARRSIDALLPLVRARVIGN